MAINGRMGLVVFNDDGQITQTVAFGRGTDVVAIEVPEGVWHSVVSLEPGTVFFETKPGPYAPLHDKDFAAWSPEENTEEAVSYLDYLRDQFKL